MPSDSLTASIMREGLQLLGDVYSVVQDAIARRDPSHLRRVRERIPEELRTEGVSREGHELAAELERGTPHGQIGQ
jgi:hypothetical protein